MKTLLRGINTMSNAAGKFGGIAMLVLIILLMVYEVVARYVFNMPTRFALEFSIYSQVLLVAFSAAFVLKEEGHVSIELVTEHLSEKRRYRWLCGNSIIGALYSAFLSLQLWHTAAWSYQLGTASETMGIPLAPIQFILLGGLLLLTLQFVVRSYTYGKKAKECPPDA